MTADELVKYLRDPLGWSEHQRDGMNGGDVWEGAQLLLKQYDALGVAVTVAREEARVAALEEAAKHFEGMGGRSLARDFLPRSSVIRDIRALATPARVAPKRQDTQLVAVDESSGAASVGAFAAAPKCMTCGGTGQVPKVARIGQDHRVVEHAPCPDCAGGER